MIAAPALLILPFRGYWLHARGEGGGADYDLVMERDADGLPIIRGRHLAGLLRQALTRAEQWGWFRDGNEVVSILMGEPDGGPPGCLNIRSAVIPDPMRSSLKADPALAAACFQRLPSTAIDGATGQAQAGHLRTVEAALPLTLTARLSFDPSDRMSWAGPNDTIERAGREWRDWIVTALPALDEAGAKRTRGFGRLSPCRLVDVPGGRA